MSGSVAVVMVVAAEPRERLAEVRDSLADQDADPFTLWVACLPAERATVEAALRPGGSVERVEILDNPGGHRSRGLNLAWRAAAASGTEVVCRIDARSRPSTSHVRVTAHRLRSAAEIGVSGGHQVPVPGSGSVVGRAIARVLGDPLAAGGAAYRRPSASGPVDTVYLGTFRTHDLDRLGGWSESLPVNEDYELCQRYHARGLGVWLEAGLDVGYESRSDLSGLVRQYADFGASKIDVWRRAGLRPRPRQLVGVLAPIVVLLGALGVLVVSRSAFAWASGASGFALLAIDARRGRGGPLLRLTAALLTVIPATAFAVGALWALIGRRGSD